MRWGFFRKSLLVLEANSESCKTSKMELFAIIVVHYFSKNLHLGCLTESDSKLASTVKGAIKSYFTYYSYVVIIFFKTGLYMSAFFIYSFGKLNYRLSVIFVFSACSILNSM